MFDWTKNTTNPTDKKTQFQVLKFLSTIREFRIEKHGAFLRNKIRNKRVLDIGVVEHDVSFMEHKNWRHKVVKEESEYCVGVDIICELVDVLNKKGYKVYCTDATSTEYLWEKFDIVLLGHVIGHVDDPIGLIKFAKRHLSEGGEILIDTPNPYFYRNLKRQKKFKSIVTNLEIIRWITPAMANEIARRAGVVFEKSLFFVSKNKLRRYLQKKSPEKYSAYFLYIFKWVSYSKKSSLLILM